MSSEVLIQGNFHKNLTLYMSNICWV